MIFKSKAMRKLLSIFILSLFISKNTIAQDDDTFSPSKLESIAANMKTVMSDNDADFTGIATPDKWKEESGIILAQKTNFSFDKDANKLAVYEITRRRIKLLDRDAVNSYSSVYFRIGSSRDGTAIKIIKSNGTTQDVSLRNAIYVEDPSDVPSTFLPYIGKVSTYIDKSKSSVVYYKIAVPDLDPGDIIDYATIFYDDNTVKKMNYIEFDPIYFVCNREYPVLAQKFSIETDDKSFVSSKSLNGAPEFKESGNGSILYTWEDRNRDKMSDTRWINHFAQVPFIKFQIVFSRQENRSDLFIGDKGELKRNLSPEELAVKVNSMYNKMNAANLVGGVNYYLKQINASDLRDDDYIQKLYYIIRHVAVIRGNGVSSEAFAYCMMEKLDNKKIPYELVVTAPYTLSTPADIIFRTEPEWLLRVKGKYIFNPTAFSNPYDFKENFLNTPAYVIKLGKNPTATAITIDNNTPEQNTTTNSLEATIDTATQNILVTTKRIATGISKASYNIQGLAYTTAFDDDFRSYGGEDDIRGNLKGTVLEQYEDRLRERKKEDKEKKLEFMKAQYKDDFDNIDKYTEFVLNSDGRSWKKQELSFSSKFELRDMVMKAGNNLLVNIPGLIGDQLYVNPDERKREFDAHMGNPRTIKNEITFNIPTGYKAVGVNNLNMSVENETGFFKVKATVEGNQLKILTMKVYKQIYVKKENWNKLLEFIDAAFNFSQKKILLKKI
jgi:hypothetical protein